MKNQNRKKLLEDLLLTVAIEVAQSCDKKVLDSSNINLICEEFLFELKCFKNEARLRLVTDDDDDG